MNIQDIESQAHARNSATWLLVIGIIATATNLRAPITSVGPLIGHMKDSLHISNTLAGMITTLPLLAFALFSPIVPRLSRKIGVERIIFLSLIMLVIGIFLRSSSGVATLYIGTALLGIAISVSNVLLPSVIKGKFPKNIGMMTGVYSISMNICGALASGISVPLAIGFGLNWQGALGIWGFLSIVSIFIWFPQIIRKKNQEDSPTTPIKRNGIKVWKSPLAWQVTLFMGLQSMMFYVLVAWLPEILKLNGISEAQSGWYLSIMQLALLPFTFIVPIIAGRMADQRSLVVVSSGLFLAGTLGLLFGSTTFALVWIILLGIGGGFAFSLAMMFFSLRTDSAEQAAELSGMAQSVGYLLAGAGPILFGYLHDVTNSWTPPLLILVFASLLLLIFGLGAGREHSIDSPHIKNAA